MINFEEDIDGALMLDSEDIGHGPEGPVSPSTYTAWNKPSQGGTEL